MTERAVRLMLSCDNCRKKKIRCDGTKPSCSSCTRSTTQCVYSPVGPRKKPRRSVADTAKRRASTESEDGVASVSHMMHRESQLLDAGQAPAPMQSPVMEMLRLQTQISTLVEQLRTLTIRVAEGGVDCVDRVDRLHEQHIDHTNTNTDVSRDLVTHLISVYFEYGHAMETGMHPTELYRDRLQRAQVSEPFLLSTLAVASRFSDDPRVHREPRYLAGYDFFERVTKGRMMDVLERDSVENMLTLNNLAVFAVGLPVANRGWYFSGLAMRMATQMSLQKADAPGRMPAASMMSGPGLESARRAFWTTLLLEALASFASGEPPPITIQDIHVAEPFDAPESLAPHEPNVCAYIVQLAKLLIRVARLNGNRHPESAQFSPQYASLHAEMVAWHCALPDRMQVHASDARDEIARDPRLFAAKMFVHCHYHAAIIALHQPRADLVRVDSAHSEASGRANDREWRQLAQQQCLTAACTMTELLALARTLDVRYHVVTFGFAVFMAGVVHVGAVACTPRNSNERQFSINCVSEHIKCLDRLGKYFAFHFIMAKHIRAQLQAIEAGGQKASSVSSLANMTQFGEFSMNVSMPNAFSPPATSAAEFASRAPWMSNDASMDVLLNMLADSAPSMPTSTPTMPTSTPSVPSMPISSLCPGASVCAGLCGSHSPQTTASMAAALSGMAGMAGMAGIGSLVELFSSNNDGSTSLYPQQILSNSSLAPRSQAESVTPPRSQTLQTDPAAPLRLTSPGGMQQYGSLPPFAS
ncbi:hypothetical protein IW148_001017 [Coemansia sp. RSA 1199]|nr:hypothetical protein IW148_001017 [Coemansia sp. RSA 1199]